MVVERFKNQSRHYQDNALRFLQEGEVQKASEFFWGSMAQALKAVAASRGMELRSHGLIRQYARELARELGDESIVDGFREADSLHSDFYEAGLTADDVTLAWETRIRPALDSLGRLLLEQ